MRVSYNWLKQYVDFTYTPHELAEKLTMVGFEVEEVITTLPELKGLLVAEVKGIEKHLNADKLSVCTVYDGRENLQIICGAPNVAVGQKVAFAPIGVKLPAGFQINKAKIRGIESFGMICSEEELGLAEKSEGIWELNSDWQVGRDLYEILKEGQDYILDISITPNRPDAMSMIGIAREVAALAGVKYKKPETEFKEVSNSDNNPVEVIIENPDGCPRYTARIIKNLTLGPSPEWMVKRLKAAGIRPINNIVDITNYVLIETGQPLHAFDLENIAHTKIVVRDSKKEEKFITLDEKERILPEKTVMICDGEKPVAIGGIMGGLNSEISTKTTDILLESAYFAPERIGPSSKKLGLSSEASIRFERGVDPEGVIYASERAAQLFVQIAGGEVLNGFVDNYSLKISKKRIKVRINRVNDILGTDISKSDIIKIFQKLDIEFSEGVAIVPTFRPDLEREVDLIEEVARCFNFDNIPLREQTSVKYDSSIILHDTYLTFLGEQIRELGFKEVITNSMVSANDLKSIKDPAKIEILNPISDDMNAMRTSLLPGLLKVASWNINRNIFDLRIYEIGRIFIDKKIEQADAQPYCISGLIHGNNIVPTWDKKCLYVDFYDIKGCVESFLEKIFLDKFEFILYDNNVYFDSEQSIEIRFGDDYCGCFGRIKPAVSTHFGIESEVFAFEVFVHKIKKFSNKNRRYKPYSRFPHIEKDLAFTVEKNIASGNICDFIFEVGKPLITKVTVFDLFENEALGVNKKSIAYRLRFQSSEKTLEDREVSVIFDKIIKEVENKFDAKLRE